MITGVYAIRNLGNRRQYIGKAIDVRGRVAQHFSQLDRVVSPCAAMQVDFDQWGVQAFQAVLVEVTLTTHAALCAEGYWIIKHSGVEPLYNSAIEIRNSQRRAARYNK